MPTACLPVSPESTRVKSRDGPLNATRYRNYHPTLGRWIERDPAGYVDGLSLYAYVCDNPIGAVDPWGLWGPSGHDDLTRNSMQGQGFSEADIAEAQQANNDVDRWTNQTNDPDHSMPGTEEEAQRRVDQRIRAVARAEAEGRHHTAMRILGQALHTAQDKGAHSDQNAGWLEHFPGGPDPDNPQKHPNDYANAQGYSDDVIRRYKEELRKLRGKKPRRTYRLKPRPPHVFLLSTQRDPSAACAEWGSFLCSTDLPPVILSPSPERGWQSSDREHEIVIVSWQC